MTDKIEINGRPVAADPERYEDGLPSAPEPERYSALRAPRRIEIDGDAFLIQGEPARDRERLVWTVDLRPA